MYDFISIKFIRQKQTKYVYDKEHIRFINGQRSLWKT